MASRLDKLVADIRACRICRDDPIGKPLPHEPRPIIHVGRKARVIIIGQAPGTKVHLSGVPFTDRSGDRLRAWMGVTSDEFYDTSKIAIMPMGFCFPGQDAKGSDLPPRRECAPRWHDALLAQLPNIKLTLLVGHYAQRRYLGAKAKTSLTETVATWREFGPSVIPLPHPSWRNTAWLKKNPWFERDTLPVMQQRIRQLID